MCSVRRPWRRVILISARSSPVWRLVTGSIPTSARVSLVGLAIGTLIGGAWQLIGQFPSLWKVGYRFHPDFHRRDEGVRTVLTLMGPAVIAASAVQVNVLINSGFAASLGNGPVSRLNIAFRLMQLPLGIFGVAIGTVTLPLVSKSAALGNTAEFRAILARGMRLAFLLTVPSAIGLAMLASPIISVIYQHGRFTAEMTQETAGALQYYAIGLVAYAALKVLTPAFYAIGKRNTPMVVSFSRSVRIYFSTGCSRSGSGGDTAALPSRPASSRRSIFFCSTR